MRIKEEYLEFIPNIYDTVLNPENWPDVLEKFPYFCGADISTVFIHDNTYTELTNVASAEKYDPARVQEYIEKHSHEDVAAFSNVQFSNAELLEMESDLPDVPKLLDDLLTTPEALHGSSVLAFDLFALLESIGLTIPTIDCLSLKKSLYSTYLSK